MKKSIEIIPAVLPKDFAELEEKIELVKGFVETVQIDVCDGQFVPNATWPYRKDDRSFAKIVGEEEGLPGWETLNYEFDLMVNRPEEIVEDWIRAGASRIILHVESKGDLAGAFSKLVGAVEIGLALSIETPFERVVPYLESLQFIQLMGIDNLGFQHQQFDDKVIARVVEVKSRFPGLKVSVDGGVSLESAPKLIQAGVDRLVVGSAIFGSENSIDAVQEFKRLSFS